MTRTLLILVVILAVLGAGCSAEFPYKHKPTEVQRQAADLAIIDLASLAPYVDPAAEPVRAEAEQAARVTQTYLGLPAERPTPKAEVNQAMLAQAKADASRPPPTVAEVGTAMIDEGQRASDTGFGLADKVLALLASIAGTYGATKLAGRVGAWRTQRDELQDQVDIQLQALREVVAGIDALTPDVKSAVKAAQAAVQSVDTTRLVAAVKTE